jgi:hypothetical protein
VKDVGDVLGIWWDVGSRAIVIASVLCVWTLVRLTIGMRLAIGMRLTMEGRRLRSKGTKGCWVDEVEMWHEQRDTLAEVCFCLFRRCIE